MMWCASPHTVCHTYGLTGESLSAPGNRTSCKASKGKACLYVLSWPHLIFVAFSAGGSTMKEAAIEGNDFTNLSII